MDKSYIEKEVMRAYVWQHFVSLMTPLELEVRRGVLIYEKVALNEDARPPLKLKSRWEAEASADALAAMMDGPTLARRQICDRIIRDHAASLTFNRCSACGKIARTPKAKQCQWCFHNWHDKSDR